MASFRTAQRIAAAVHDYESRAASSRPGSQRRGVPQKIDFVVGTLSDDLAWNDNSPGQPSVALQLYKFVPADSFDPSDPGKGTWQIDIGNTLEHVYPPGIVSQSYGTFYATTLVRVEWCTASSRWEVWGKQC